MSDRTGVSAMAIMVDSHYVFQLVVFSSYVFGFLSVWLVVFITLENYIRICHPFSVARFCTVQKVRYRIFTRLSSSHYRKLQRYLEHKKRINAVTITTNQPTNQPKIISVCNILRCQYMCA